HLHDLDHAVSVRLGGLRVAVPHHLVQEVRGDPHLERDVIEVHADAVLQPLLHDATGLTPRLAAQVEVATGPDHAAVAPLDGQDATCDDCTVVRAVVLRDVTDGERVLLGDLPAEGLLLDETAVAGEGPLHADDALPEHPLRGLVEHREVAVHGPRRQVAGSAVLGRQGERLDHRRRAHEWAALPLDTEGTARHGTPTRTHLQFIVTPPDAPASRCAG